MTAAVTFSPNDLLTPAVAADPYPAYRQLRDQSPVSYGSMQDISLPDQRWGLMRYEDVYNALRDHGTFSSETASTGQFGQKMVLLQDDPPRHSRLRRLVNTAFTLKRVEALEPWIGSIYFSHCHGRDRTYATRSSYGELFWSDGSRAAGARSRRLDYGPG